ncbi:flagellar hook-basal body complex protein [uncultured Litoreibacter sp.]|uniref:flagellar hook-basal body complex protein n=1 Tax=uncultured Litoreibacter sp. TaxID=1392394 RepID=UPI002601A0FB|nr:flagellar hook-basal body complex protein [uncultured Litoreibacter sp.]
MTNSIYASLARQSGLMKEMQSVAHNIANSATTGFRANSVVFSEFVNATGGDQPSLSMATAGAHLISQSQGSLTQTGGHFDFAIEGEGFFQIETPNGIRISRAGAFFPTPEGDLVTADGHRVLDAGGAPVFVPSDAGEIALASDGTLSVSGNPLAQLGIVRPADGATLIREDGVRFNVDGEVEIVENPTVLQGFLESSNVDPVGEIARMIQVQRAYEMGQSFLEKEEDRLRSIMSLISNR